MDARIQSHRTITNAGNSGFFVRYSIGREVLEEIPYGEGYSYGNRGVNSQRVHSYNNSHFGNYFFILKFTNFAHTNYVRARQETRNFNSEFGFSE